MQNQFTYAARQLVDTLKERYDGWDGVGQFEGSIERIARMYEEFCWTPEKIQEEAKKVFKVFDHSFEEMVVVGPTSVVILCPHHMMPCGLKVMIGYIPNGDGKVLGLSKVCRIAEIMGKRPILQEQYCQELVTIIEEKLKPRGVAIYAVGSHGCMTFRGVKQHAKAITSIVRGDFKTEPETRHEFLELAHELNKEPG